MKTIIVLPVYNEEKTLRNQLVELHKQADFMIVINDGSRDQSGEIIEKWQKSLSTVCFINHRVNRGKANALKEAFIEILNQKEKGKFKGNDKIVITDADGQFPTNVIYPSLEYHNEKELDVLINCRDFSIYPFIKKLGNFFLSKLAGILTGFNFKDTQCGLRILKVSALEKILPHYRASGYSCEQELSIIPVILGMKVDNSFPVKTLYYRSNSTFSDAFKITYDSFATFFRVRAFINADKNSN